MAKNRWFRLRMVWIGAAATLMLAPTVFAASTIAVSQQNRTFMPGELTITQGTTLHIVNDDKVTHHIYVDSPTMKFDSGEQPMGSTVDLVFDKQGTFTVLCAIHPTMHLKVAVQ